VKPLWKVTWTLLSLTELRIAIMMQRKPQPMTWSKVYRWRWRARLAAFPSALSLASGGYTVLTAIEPVWPDAENVVALRPVA
jgi:hypothetical protein